MSLPDAKSRWLALLLLLWLACAACVAHAADPAFPSGKWAERLDSPDWSAARLAAADEVARTIGTTAYAVIDRGVIVHKLGPVNRAFNLHSGRKSILSLLYGIHVDRGEIDIRKTMKELGINDRSELSDVELQATVQNLLQARSGIYHPAAYETADMANRRPQRGSHKPGESWYYNNFDFNALGTIFRQATGKNVFEALRDDLATPLQFEDFSYTLHTKWIHEPASQHPAYEIRMSALDLARIGLLTFQHIGILSLEFHVDKLSRPLL